MTPVSLLHPRTCRRVLTAALLVLASVAFNGSAATNFSAWVYPGPSGGLIHRPDAQGNRLIDGSGVGYKGGLVPLPTSNTVPVKVTLSPIAGDNTAHIQAAINQVQALPLDTNGFRGAVLLSAGEYPCNGTITINASGVVLRGVGSATNGSGTVLRATASNQYSLVRITGSGSASTSTSHIITNRYVPVGARSFHVDSTSGFAVGDRVFVRRYATQGWINDIGMDELTNPWSPGSYTVSMDRLITRIEGNRVFIDNPVTCAIDAGYTNGALLKYSWSSRIQNSGIEHIYGKSDFFGNSTNENHGWIFVQFNSIENGWARDLTSQYFGYACVALYSGSKNVTVTDSRCLDPISIVTGGRRYAFVLDDCVACLVKNCYTRQDRHQFVTQSLTTGPNVFVDCLSDNARSDVGPHHRWATAAIWDNVTINGQNINIQNRGNSGSGHGWAGANCAVWNSDADGGYTVQNPPTAHNWLIGSIGNIEVNTNGPGPHDPGTFDSHGTNVFPHSLYFGQLQDRLAMPKLQVREYWLGTIDTFTNTNPRDVVALDSTWSNAVQTVAAGQSLDPFNVVSNNHWVPFTFNYTISSTDQVVAATLTLALRATNSAAGNVLYLGSTNNSFTFSNLNWLPIGTGTNTTVRVVDLAGQFNLLTNGQFNVAVQGDAGIDWAMLELRVAPAVNAGTTTLPPVADATVRGGVNANSNFGALDTLTVKNDSSADNTRQAYLRWDLAGITQTVFQARIRLMPVSVGTNAIEQGVRVANSNTWSEAVITWNNQPGAGERFANWIPGTNVPVSFDVTPQVLDALAGDKQLSLQLFSVRNVGAAGTVDYASRENADANSRPQLVLSTLGSVPVISDITNRLVAVNASTGPIPFTVGDSDSDANTLVLNGASSNTNLVPPANILFGGSGSNRTVTVTPASNQSGAALITVTVTDVSGLSAADTFTLTVSSHPPGVFVWNGPGAGANNWSASGNWSPLGPPEALDDVKFFDPGAAGLGVSNVNNVVDASFGGSIASLQYANTNDNHTTLIATGGTLNLLGTNGLIAGTETDNGSTQTVFATITGPGAVLAINNSSADLVVRQGNSAGGSQRATLDLSGLDTVAATLDQVLVGFAGPVTRATGTLLLGRTNTITATGSPGLCAGDNGSNSGGQNIIYLGQQNEVFADSIVIGRRKATATLRFNAGFPGSSASFRGSDGASRVSTWSIGDHSLIGGSTSSSIGTNDFTGGTLDALVNTLVLGKSQTASNANSIGVLTFTDGTLDVNTLQAGFQSQSGATSGGIGYVNVNGANALLNVNTVLELGHTSGGAGTASSFGALDITGGTLLANSISAGAGSGANSIALTGATLVLTNTAGTLASPIAVFTPADSTLQFNVATGTTNFVAASLATGGTSNLINVASLSGIGSVPAQLALIKYSGAIGGAGFNFVLGSLPAGLVTGGYLSNNIANSSVDLVITNYLVPDSFLTWDGTVTAEWDTETANWKNNAGPGLTYADGDAVVFNDTAAGATNIILADTLVPAGLTVSNAVRTYLFEGGGEITGTAALIKQGAGTLTIANSGGNDFTGGVTIQGGALVVGNGGASGNLPGVGTISNNAALAFNRSDNLTVSNVISGPGTLTQKGGGVLTLAAANTFTGPTIVSSGTLKVAHTAALGSGAGSTTISNGATLDLNHTNIASEALIVSGDGAGGNGALVDNSGNPGFLSPHTVSNVTLAGHTTFGGTGRWDLRSSSTSLTNAWLSTGGNAYKLTKKGTNQVSIVSVVVDPALADIDVLAGIFSVEKTTTSLGNPTNALTVFSNATLQFFQVSNAFNKILVLNGGATVFNNSGSNTWGGPVTLQGSSTFNAGGTWLRFTNVLNGAGGVVKIGGSTLFLNGVNTCSGSTLVNAGTLALTNNGSISSSPAITIASGATLNVTGRSDGTLTLAGGQTLSGVGSMTGNLTVNPGAAVSPGTNSLGILPVSGAVTLQGATLMDLNKATATNDVLQAGGTITYGGTLVLTNLSGTLAAGDGFKLFNAAAYSGAFTGFVPATPKPGLMWDTSLLTVNGTLKIALAPSPVITSVALSGTDLIFTGANGQANGAYRVLSSTDVALPLVNWTAIATNTFDGSGGFTVTNPIDPGAPRLFYLLQLQ